MSWPAQESTKALPVLLLRWIAFLPVAFASAWLAWIVMNVLGRWSLTFAGVEAGSFFDLVFQTTTAHAVMGGVFVVIGTKIAPTHRRVVIFILAGIAVLLSGASVFAGAVVQDWWAMAGAVSTAVGAGGALYAVHHDASFRAEYFGTDSDLGPAADA